VNCSLQTHIRIHTDDKPFITVIRFITSVCSNVCL
jgi:hypothetical protein